MEWGWNPDTIIAFATCVATFAAIVAGVFAALSFIQMKRQAREAWAQTAHARRQVEESQKQTLEAKNQSKATLEQLEWAREDRERAQAESIAAWTESENRENNETLRIVLQNLSSAPVNNVRVATRMGTEKNPEYFYAARQEFLPPTGRECHKIEPSKASTDHWPTWKRKPTRNPHPRVDIIFTDARGINWVRKADGRLAKYVDGTKIPGDWKKSTGQNIIPTAE